MDFKCFQKGAGRSENLNEVYDFLKIISEKNRLRIICLLRQKTLCVCEIYKALKISQKLTSHHLGQLRRQGLLDKKKEGSFVYYSLNKKMFDEKIKLLNQLIK